MKMPCFITRVWGLFVVSCLFKLKVKLYDLTLLPKVPQARGKCLNKGILNCLGTTLVRVPVERLKPRAGASPGKEQSQTRRNYFPPLGENRRGGGSLYHTYLLNSYVQHVMEQ